MLEAEGFRIVSASDFAAYEKLRRDIVERRAMIVDIGMKAPR